MMLIHLLTIGLGIYLAYEFLGEVIIDFKDLWNEVKHEIAKEHRN